MRNVFITMSIAAMIVAATACTSAEKQNKTVLDETFRQEREFLNKAIKGRSPDVQRVDLVGNTVVYTHIYDGIVDVKTYTYDGDVCVEAERVYTFPNQMSALRHYRNAIEKTELYDDIKLMGNEVKYNLKAVQHDAETKGLTKEQLKDKFDKRIVDAKEDVKKTEAEVKGDLHRKGDRKK